jgi:hypothetical protein
MGSISHKEGDGETSVIGCRTGLSIVYALLLLLAGAVSAQTSLPLQVDAYVGPPGKEPTVSFSITNNTKEAVVINESALPWGDRYGVLLFAVTKREQQPLNARYPVSDIFVEKPVRLESKASIRGTVRLSDRFSDLSAVLGKDDLLVFWFYEPKDANRAELGKYGGWLLIPKTKVK